MGQVVSCCWTSWHSKHIRAAAFPSQTFRYLVPGSVGRCSETPVRS